MYDKIAIINNKISLLRYDVRWQEQAPSFFDRKSGKKIDGEIVQHSKQVTNTKVIEETLKKRNIPYTVTQINVPSEMEQYDGMEWSEGRDKAIFYINGAPEILITKLKAQLAATDYKAIKFAEGYITPSDYAPIRAQRQAIRAEISRLETNRPND